MPAGGPLLQCSGSAAGPSLQQPGLLGYGRPASIAVMPLLTGDEGLLTSEERTELNRLRKENLGLRREMDFFRAPREYALGGPPAVERGLTTHEVFQENWNKQGRHVIPTSL